MRKFLFEAFFWLFYGLVCPKCGEQTGYRFVDDCDVCEAVARIKFRNAAAKRFHP